MTTWSLCPFGYEAELDVLEIRLATLDELVDVHVIAEATHTFSGARKPLHLENALLRDRRFRRFKPRIEYVAVRDMPRGRAGAAPQRMFTAAENAHWRRENHQREALLRGCAGMEPGDLVYLSDLDEIASPAAFEIANAVLAEREIWRPAIPLHVGYLNWRWPVPVPVIARFMRGHTLLERGPQAARLEQGSIEHPPYDQPAAFGWHLSYLGGPVAIIHKIRTAAHAELDCPEFTDGVRIRERLTSGADLFDRPDRQAEWVDVDQLPPYVAEQRGRFAHLLVDRPTA